MADESTKPAYGFDLGTTYSAVAVSEKGKAEVLVNLEGKKTTPSVVAYLKEEKIVGYEALKQAEVSPQNVLFETKRMMGRTFNDATLQKDLDRWPFHVKEGKQSRTVMEIQVDGKTREITPEEVGADILRQLKVNAENLTETKIKDCVITVPASFDETQRQATIDAAKIAGLRCLRLLNEPTAAAVAYGVSKQMSGKILIYDFGGGTFDATILSIEEGTYEVIASGGDDHCGSKDLDNSLVDFIMKTFNSRKTPSTSTDINKPENYESKKKLYIAVEEAKIGLARKPHHNLEILSFVKGNTGRYIDLKITISRATLEKLAKPLIEKTVKLTLDLMKDNKILKEDIDKVVCVGGFTKMPSLREQLKKEFGEDKLSLGVNPDEAVALGAAMMAEVYSNEQRDGDQDDLKGLPDLLIDVTSLALGIELENGIMSKIIQSNTPVPATSEDKYTTSYDNQTAVKISVYQGNRPFVKDNKKLGEFKLQGIPKMAKGQADIRVKFHLTADGVLSVTANEKSGKNQQLVISKDKMGALSKEELEKMITDAESFAEEDNKRKELVLEKLELERLINDCEDVSSQNGMLTDAIKEITDWMNSDAEKKAGDFTDKAMLLKGMLDCAL